MKNLPMSKNTDVLKQEFIVDGITIPNRLTIQPMEGADGTKDGSPGGLTLRRYDRFAKGGTGLIWYEAVAVEHEGRANPHQLWMHEKNLDDFKRQVARIRNLAKDEAQPNPVIILQATHSGRYSKPNGGTFEPIIACNNPIYEKDGPLPAGRIVTDDHLRCLEESYATATRLAISAGFDGIDIKACHRYLVGELLSAHTRGGFYGGPLENRMRFFANAVGQARAIASPGLIVTTRMNIFDGIPYPYGFGANENAEPVMDEPIEVIKALKFSMVNISMGNPYFNPNVNRPTDLAAVERMYSLTKHVRDACDGVKIVASAPTFMRGDAPYLSAGAVEQDYADSVGFGRLAFAYPNFAKDMLNGRFDEKMVCVTCGKCTELMRGSKAGCAVRDSVYTELYRELKERQQK